MSATKLFNIRITPDNHAKFKKYAADNNVTMGAILNNYIEALLGGDQRMINMTPFKTLYYTWWRMPIEEFNVYHRMKPYFIIGQLDQSKEILIPREKDGQAGYDVINPLYCYEGGKISFKNAFLQEGDPI